MIAFLGSPAVAHEFVKRTKFTLELSDSVMGGTEKERGTYGHGVSTSRNSYFACILQLLFWENAFAKEKGHTDRPDRKGEGRFCEAD